MKNKPMKKGKVKCSVCGKYYSIKSDILIQYEGKTMCFSCGVKIYGFGKGLFE